MRKMDDTAEQLNTEAEQLYAAMRILRDRFPEWKFEETRTQLRKAAVELISKARHPSRQVPS